jgi:hypothetical protein
MEAGVSALASRSAPDELLITYAANSWNFWGLFNDPRLYWPRFVRVNVTPK